MRIVGFVEEKCGVAPRGVAFHLFARFSNPKKLIPRFSLSLCTENDEGDTDEYLARGGKADHVDAAATAATQRLSKLNDALAGLDEYASEKRSAKREGTLRRLFRALTQYGTGPIASEIVYTNVDNIRRAAFHGIRTGQPAEQYAACRVVEATSVVLGADQDEWCESLDRQLRRVVETTTRAVPVRAAALRALSMSNFINSSDMMASNAMMDLCEEVSAPQYRNETVPSTLRATALDCWALLGTTIADFHLAGSDDVQMGRGLHILELLKNCLETSSVELRSAAGECVALIHEARLKLGITDEEGENVTARRYRRGSWDGTQWEVLMDEVKQLIAELSVESGHHMSKKAKKEQRATFREFMTTIVEDESPEETVTFRGGCLTLKSWREIIQLNFVRHCLQGGFQIQLLTNETLQEIFGADGTSLNEYGSLSQLEKRLVMSKTSEAAKNADIDLTRQRRKRQNVKNHFLTSDGEDI